MKVALISIAALASPAVAAPLPSYAPSGQWVVAGEPTGCIASHNFRTADGHEVVVGLERLPSQPGAKIHFQKAAKVGKIFDGEDAVIRVNGKETKYQSLTFEPSTKPGFARLSTAFGQEEYDALLRSGALSLKSSHLSAEMAIPELDKLAPVLAMCEGALLESWGMSRPDQARLASFPTLAPGVVLFTSDDYPSQQLERGGTGRIRVLLQVAADGSAKSCETLRGTGHSDIDRRSCAIMLKRARFTPARDRSGAAMASPFAIQISWMIG